MALLDLHWVNSEQFSSVQFTSTKHTRENDAASIIKYLLILLILNKCMSCRVSDNHNRTGLLVSIFYPPIKLCSLWAGWLRTKQPIQAVIDPLIRKWPAVVKGLGHIDRQEEMEA